MCFLVAPRGTIVTNKLCISKLLSKSDRLQLLHFGYRVILNFGPHNQPEGRNGGLFGRWLGAYCETFPLGITYEDWRKIEKHKKDECWNAIQVYLSYLYFFF